MLRRADPPLKTMTRLCPACRLPHPPDQIHMGDDAGVFIVFAICQKCTARYRKLPAGTRHKLLNGALVRVATDPGRYWCSTFTDEGAAHLAACLLAYPRLVQETLAALAW